jgi:hypothetical protein
MIVLDNGDKLRGDASAATVVDYTIHGVVSSALVQMADGQLASSEGDLYTAAVDAIVVTTITFVNTSAVARTMNLYLQPSGGTSRRVIPEDMSLGAGYSLHWTGDKISVINISGELITSFNGTSVSGTPEANDIARFTDADTVEGRSYTELKGDLNLEIGTDVLAQQTIGIANDNLLEVDGTPLDTEVAVFTANGINGLSTTEVKSLLTYLQAGDAINMADAILSRAVIKDYAETPNAETSAATTVIDVTDGNVVSFTLTEATTVSTTNILADLAGSLTMVITAAGTEYAITWPATWKWAGGAAPSTFAVSTEHIVTLMWLDGDATGTFYATYINSYATA